MKLYFYLKGMSVFVLALILFAPGLLAQEQYGALKIRVVDESGALMPGAPIELTSPALMSPITATSNAQGTFLALSLPPGFYTVTVRASGFKTATLEKIPVEIGRTYPVEVVCEVGDVAETVVVESRSAKIDLGSTETALNLSSEQLLSASGGRNFALFANYMPSVNSETLSGGISVDGSSGAENVFYIDGIDTTSMYTGLNNQRVRTDTIEEFQLKTAGYEAQYGGAMGGVFNVRTKSGTNDVHGSVFYYYRGDALDASRNKTLRLNPLDANIGEFITYPDDDITDHEFGVTVGGPIVKDRAWFFGAFIPEQKTTTRLVGTVDSGNNAVAPVDWSREDKDRHITAKFDFSPADVARLTFSYVDDWEDWTGSLPGLDAKSDDDYGYPVDGWTFPGRTLSGAGTFTFSPNFVVEARWGLNSTSVFQKLGPTETRHFILGDMVDVGYSTSDPMFRPFAWAEYCYACGLGTNQDYQKKNTIKLDASYVVSGAGGTHNLNFGWQFNKLSHDINEAYTFNYIRYYYAQTHTNIDGTTPTSSCVGPDGNTYDPCGYYEARAPMGVLAAVSTNRQAIYFQDSWSRNRLTINAGLRFEKEEIPSFSDLPEFAGAAFSWNFMDKFAPRLGFAYDLAGDGKTKIHASWGWFYDAMKLEMAQGSFGGFKWLSHYYLMDQSIIDNGWAAMTGLNGADPTPSGWPGTFMETRNWRIPSFDDLDPDLKPMRMSEFVAGIETEAIRNIVVSLKFTHKQLDEAIEDVGRQTAAGEAYYITNPGRGFSVSKFLEAGLPPTPKPDRTYNAMELRIRRRMVDNWSVDLAYVSSRLRGLYSGLGSSDENGRLSPNVDRDFDLWFLNYDASGNLLSGPLNTDRPHQFKANWSYLTPWKMHIGGFFRAMSGTPITRTADIEFVDISYLNRGSDGRNPFWTQTDIQLIQDFTPFDNESQKIEIRFNVLNLFNARTALTTFRSYTEAGAVLPLWQAGDPTSQVLNGYDVDALMAADGVSVDPRFLMRDRFMTPLSMRFGVRFVF